MSAWFPGIAASTVPARDRAGVADRLADAARVAALWAELSAAPGWTRPPVWLHGDLHPANLVLRDGAIAAVIDFGDLTAGEPATDLATAWLTFDSAGRHRFVSRGRATLQHVLEAPAGP